MKIILIIVVAAFLVNGWAQDNLSVSGTLESQGGRCPVDWVPLSAQDGDTLTIHLTSDEFDSYLYLSNSNSTNEAYLITEDDDSGGGLDAEIRYTLDRDSFLYVGVSSLDCSTGSYTLESRISHNWNEPDSSLVGVLNDDSEQMLDGRYINWHRVYLTRGTVTILQTSDDLDAYIFLARDTGGASPLPRDILERSDVCGLDSLDACVTLSVEQSAYYLVGASSYYENELGFYRIEISTQTVPNHLEPIQRSGSFTPDDERFYLDNTPIDWHTFTVPWGGARVVIDLISTNVDPYLILARCHIWNKTDDNACAISVNDDGSEGLNAHLDVMLEGGTYYVGANTTGIEFGSYTLYIQQMPEQFDSLGLISSLE
jgi:hypothetical protein